MVDDNKRELGKETRNFFQDESKEKAPKPLAEPK